jgi:threonyl-tRNA synthetase
MDLSSPPNASHEPTPVVSAAAATCATGYVRPDKCEVWLKTLHWTPVDPAEYKALDNESKLLRIRHSVAHIMAHALQDIDPKVSFATGPATAMGFFYDVVPSVVLKEDHLAELEKRMAKICGQSLPFEWTVVPKADARGLFENCKQIHKLEVLERIPSDTVTLYRSGNFVDLCAGPHVPHTGLCRNVKLLGIAASHWRGEDTPSLTRLSGTAWSTDKELARYLEFLEDSKARDHRVLGPQLDLFAFHPWASGAMWHPKGVRIRRGLETYWRETLERYGYQEILNPLLYRKELYEMSGHWDHYQDNMFIFSEDPKEGQSADSCCQYAIKPMNCPDTMLYFKSNVRSYRDLPMRIAEGQILHRNEATGAMHGLMRTRMFTQDDAHIFVSADQVAHEVAHLFKMLNEVYALFQLDYSFSLSTRPEKFLGDIAVWDQAEAALRQSLDATGKPYLVEEGEGAFYGPKIDFQIRDSLGRQWQCGTFQLDFQLPQRFDLHYIAPDGSHQQPIVIHRAIFGSFERFIGILTEHLGGAFPTWLTPVQAVVLPITEHHVAYAQQVVDQLKAAGIRVEMQEAESINYRVRQAEMRKIPYMLVVGDREAEAGQVAVRQYKVKEKRTLATGDMIAELQTKIAERTFDVTLTQYNDLFWKPPETLSTESAEY